MRVRDLIEKLQTMPPDATVETEGCDCIGRAEGVRLDGYEVLITRTMDETDRVRRSLLYPLFFNEVIPNSDDILEDAVKG